MNVCLLLSRILGGRKGPPTPVTYTISGSIVDGAAAGIEGVTVTLSGDADDSTTTDGDGAYSFTGLSDGSYTVTPTKDGYVFTDASENVSVSGGNASVDNMVGVLTYITGLPFYIEGGWQDESVPSYGAQPANDWLDVSDPALTGITNIETPERNSHTPSQDRSIQLNTSASGTTRFHRIDYLGWVNDGLKFDPSKGIRFMVLAARLNDATYTRIDIGVDSADGTKRIRGNYSNSPPGQDTTSARETYDAIDNQTPANCSTSIDGTTELWCAVGVEVPANYSGNIVTRAVIFGGGGATVAGSSSHAIANDWSSIDLNRVEFQSIRDGSGQVVVNWMWVGTASDDWPV